MTIELKETPTGQVSKKPLNVGVVVKLFRAERRLRALGLKGPSMTNQDQGAAVDWLDWAAPVGQLEKLRTAVRVLAEGSGTWRERMDAATLALVTMRSEDFPKRLRNRAARVLSIRRKVGSTSYVGGDYFHFEKLKPKERMRFVADIIALYEACLIDIGRTWPTWDFVYPEDVDPPLETGE